MWFSAAMAAVAVVSAVAALLSLRQTKRNVGINAERLRHERTPCFRAELDDVAIGDGYQEVVRFHYDGPEELASVDVELNIGIPARHSPIVAISGEGEPTPRTNTAELRCPLKPGDERMVWVLREDSRNVGDEAVFRLHCTASDETTWTVAVRCLVPGEPFVGGMV